MRNTAAYPITDEEIRAALQWAVAKAAEGAALGDIRAAALHEAGMRLARLTEALRAIAEMDYAGARGMQMRRLARAALGG